MSTFTKAFLKVWDIHAPYKKCHMCFHPMPWMNNATLQSINSCNAAYCIDLHDRSLLNLIANKKLHNKTKYIIWLAKTEFVIHGLCSGMSYFFKNIKCCSGFIRVKNTLNPWPWAICTSRVFSK